VFHPAAPLSASAVAALLEHRAELQLADYQVEQLTDIERKRDEADRAVEVDLEAQLKEGEPRTRSSSRPVAAGGRGGRGGGGRAMPGNAQNQNAQPHGEPPNEDDRVAVAQQRIDENDAKANSSAEAVMTDEQREQAQKIMSRYREDVAKQRDDQQRVSAQK
jgi:hypothetical protein